MSSNKPPRDLDAIATEIHQLERSTIFEYGELLVEAQEACEHGQWLDWLAQEFDWSHDTAMRYMAAYRLADKFRTVRNLRVPASTIYDLASEIDDPDLPAIIDALDEATEGRSKPIGVGDAEHVIILAKARREYGDYPEAALIAMSLVDDGSPEAAATIAALKEARPTTEDAADEIVAKFRPADAWAFRPTDADADDADDDDDDDADDDDAGDDDAGDDDAGDDDADDDEQTDAEAEQQPPRAEVAKLVRAWAQASPGVRRQFVRERWDEIARARKQLDADGVDHEDRWIEGDQDYDNRTRKSAQ